MKKLTLAHVKNLFNHWRKTRTNKRAKIPETLWRKAAALTSDYKIYEIVKALRLSGTDFSKNRKLYINPANKMTQKFTRVTFEPPIITESSLIPIEFKKQGISMTIQVPNNQARIMIQEFLGATYVANHGTE